MTELDNSEVFVHPKTQHPNGTNQQQYDNSNMYKLGEIGMHAVIKYLNDNKEELRITNVEDVSKNSELYAEATTDIIVTTISGKKFRIEVKSDTHIKEKGNFCCELFRHYFAQDELVPGWGIRLRADYICHVYVNGNTNVAETIYIISKSRWNTGICNAFNSGVRTGCVKTDEKKYTYNCYIPIDNFNLSDNRIIDIRPKEEPKGLFDDVE